MVILPDAARTVIAERAEHLRNQVKHLRVEHKNQMLDTVTLSLGVAMFPDHGATGEAVLKSADAALYRAKRDGRDRVIVADAS